MNKILNIVIALFFIVLLGNNLRQFEYSFAGKIAIDEEIVGEEPLEEMMMYKDYRPSDKQVLEKGKEVKDVKEGLYLLADEGSQKVFGKSLEDISDTIDYYQNLAEYVYMRYRVAREAVKRFFERFH